MEVNDKGPRPLQEVAAGLYLSDLQAEGACKQNCQGRNRQGGSGGAEHDVSKIAKHGDVKM